KFEKREAPPPKSRRALIVGAIVAAVLAGVGIFVAQRPKENPVKPPVAVPPALPHLEYSITVQHQRNNKPFGGQFQLPGEMLFQQDDLIALNIRTREPGYLYVLNKGPDPDNGAITINVLNPDRD